MLLEPSGSILASFGITEKPRRLPGGQGNTFQAGNIILKPADNPQEVSWYVNNFSDIHQEGFRLPSPIPSRTGGGHIVDGWWALQYLPGEILEGKTAIKLAVSDNLHRSLQIFPKPDWINHLTDPYSVADRMVWGQEPLSYPEVLGELIEPLLELLEPLEDIDCQLIHGDLSSNILVDDHIKAPGVIDFALYWRPAAYAKAVIVADALSWEGADKTVIDLIKNEENWFQLLLRAELARILQKGTLWEMKGLPIKDMSHHQKVVKLLTEIYPEL